MQMLQLQQRDMRPALLQRQAAAAHGIGANGSVVDAAAAAVVQQASSAEQAASAAAGSMDHAASAAAASGGDKIYYYTGKEDALERVRTLPSCSCSLDLEIPALGAQSHGTSFAKLCQEHAGEAG